MRLMVKALSALSVMALSGCGGPDPRLTEAERAANQALAAAERAEAAANAAEKGDFSQTDTASTPQVAPTTSSMSRNDAESIIKAFINVQGHLCADVVSTRPLALPNAAEVKCIEYRGGSNTVTYVVNMKSGRVEKGG